MDRIEKKKNKIQVKSPTQERSKQTVSSILEACARIIERDGYFAVTTDKIAEEAGVSIGSLYQFFGNKESVVSALIKQLIDEDRQYFFEKMRSHDHLSKPEKLKKMLEVGFEIHQIKPELRAALQSVRYYLSDHEYSRKSRHTFIEYLQNNLNHLSPSRDPHKAAYLSVTTFLSILNSTSGRHPGFLNDPILVDELTLMFKRYLELN